MNEATGVLRVRLKEIQIPSDGHRLGDLLVPPSLIGTMLVEGQHANGDARLRCIVPPSQDATFVGAYFDPVSGLRVSLNVLDATTEDPRVFPADALVAFGFQRDRGKGGGGGIHGAKLTLGFLARPTDPILAGFDETASVPCADQNSEGVPVARCLGKEPFVRLDGTLGKVFFQRLAP